MHVAAEKCKCMASLEKCNSDTWGVVSDEVGKIGKRWDEWGDRIQEEGAVEVYLGGNEEPLKRVSQKDWQDQVCILEKSHWGWRVDLKEVKD